MKLLGLIVVLFMIVFDNCSTETDEDFRSDVRQRSVSTDDINTFHFSEESRFNFFRREKMFISNCWFLCILFVTVLRRGLSLSLAPFILPEALDELRAENKIEEFIKFLGIPHVDLCFPSADENLLPMFNEDLPFGDLILKEEVKEDSETDTDDIQYDFNSVKNSSPKSFRKKHGRKRKWKNGLIPYYISKDYTFKEKKIIKKAISGMNSKLTRIKFRPFNYLFDTDYLFIFSGKGCYSKLGMVGGEQPLSLQADICLKNGVIQHELTHAIGFSHEQNRPDRDDYIRLLVDNIPHKWLKEYQRKNTLEAAYVGMYDYYSVMHYPPYSPEDKNKRVLEVLDDCVDEKDVGNREELSNLDVEKIEEFYDTLM